MLKQIASGLLLAAAALGIAAFVPASEPPAKPNVIIIFMDDMGYGDPSCYGGGPYTTPHLDRMAARGMRFTHFYSAEAVCSASRA